MSILLFSVGAIAVIAGVLMAGFGIPVSEFSFGNTLIGAGATTAMGGLIVIGLGAVVSKLQQISDSLATQAPVQPIRPLEAYEPAIGARAAPAPVPAPAAITGRISFPTRPKPEPHPLEPRAATPAQAGVADEGEPVQSFAPSLRNPDVPPVTVDDDVSLSPQHPATVEAAPADLGAPAGSAAASDEEPSSPKTEPSLDAGWGAPSLPPLVSAQPRQRGGYFDAMWPADEKPARSPAANEAKPEPTLEVPPRESVPPSADAEAEPSKAPVPILKSGVVDGMRYTLYVDGSIEAELPQGTLRFASINELRSHLEKNS